MGSIKDRNDMDLTEAEDIKKKGYTVNYYFIQKFQNCLQ